MQPEALDSIQSAFTSAARLALRQPETTRSEQYKHLETLGQILLDQGRGNRPWGDANLPLSERPTPAELMARMSEKHPRFKGMVERFDHQNAGQTKPASRLQAATIVSEPPQSERTR